MSDEPSEISPSPLRWRWPLAAGGVVVVVLVAGVVVRSGLDPGAGDALTVAGETIGEDAALLPDGDVSPGPASERVGVEVTAFDIPVAVAIRVLAVRFNDPSLALVDLATGEVATYSAGALGLPRDAISGATLLTDGTAVVWQDGTVRAFPPGLDSSPLVYTPTNLINPSWAAPSLRVVPTADERALWVVQIGSCCPDDIPGRVELMDLDTGQAVATTELPASSFPVATTAHGLVLNTHRYITTGHGWTSAAGSHQVLLLTESGTVARLAPGEALAASDHAVAVLTCEDHERRRNCALDLVDVTSRDRHRVSEPVAGTWTGVNGADVPGDIPPWSAAAPDGRILAGIASRAGLEAPEWHPVAIHPEGDSVAALHRFDGWPRPAAWDQRGEHIVLAEPSHLTVLDLSDGSLFTLRDIIPTDHHVVAMR